MNVECSNRCRWAWGVAAVVAAVGLGLWQGKSWANAEQPVAAAPAADASQPHVTANSPVEAGRYLVKLGGCNDCHTANFAMTGGNVPEADWLLGDGVGHRGPWGTTYASNLRLFVKDLGEKDFLMIVRNRNTRPPMPWTSLHAMSDQDLTAIFAYLKSLPVAGKPTPEYVPPTDEPKTPYVSYMPIMPAGVAPAEGK